MALVKTSGTYESFAHRLLWDSAQRHFLLAVEHATDSWQLHLSGALLAAAAYEAYLNYLLANILPDVWANERTFFARDEYRGIEGKLKRIAEELNWPLPRKDRRPRCSVVELQALRDKIVHAKPNKQSYETIHDDHKPAPLPASWLTQEAPAHRVRKWVEDAEAFAVAIHKVVQSKHKILILGTHPFRGMLGFGSHWTMDVDKQL